VSSQNNLVAFTGNPLVGKHLVVPDGAGGVILGFEHQQAFSSIFEVFVQRVTKTAGTAGGFAGIATGGFDTLQFMSPTVDTVTGLPDGDAILSVEHGNTSTPALKLFDAEANLADPGATLAAQNQGSPAIPAIVNGDPGAMVAWSDGTQILVQIFGAGAVPQLTAGGLTLTSSPAKDNVVRMVPDGNGGGIIAWVQNVSGTDYVTAANVNSAGQTVWGPVLASGLSSYAITNATKDLQAAPDGQHGATLAWSMTNGTNAYISAVRLDSAGTVHVFSGLLRSGSALAGTTSDLQLVGDASQGAIVCWVDTRDGNSQVYAQHIDLDGHMLWTTDGVLIASTGSAQSVPQIATDSAGSAIIAWQENNGIQGTPHIYALRLDPTDGSPSKLGTWGTSGNAVSVHYDINIFTGPNFGTNGSNQTAPVIAPDGQQGAIIIWNDDRPPYFGNGNAYFGQRIRADGTLGN
jgi:hypothetical protein